MGNFVLVHPAWFGGWCWDKLAPQLRAHGHQVYTPTLTGLSERAHLASPDVGLLTHVEDVTAVVLFEDLRDVVLVGSSSSGSVVTAVAARIPDRVASLVYLDAFVPADGQCTRDLLSPERRATLDLLVETEGGGWLLPRFAPPPWLTIVRDMWEITNEADIEWVLPRLRPTPYRHFTDPVNLAGTDFDGIDRLYVRCPRQPAPFDTFAEAARSSRAWRYVELDTPHLPYVTHPDLVTDVLLDTVSR